MSNNFPLSFLFFKTYFAVEIKAYMVYCYTIFRMSENMGNSHKTEEIRWQVIKAMLDEFPVLKERVRNYLREQKPKR